MADIITRGDSFTFFLGTDGEFKVDKSWLDGLQTKLQKMTDAEIEVTLNDRADHLSVRAIGECKSDKLDLDRLMRRLSRAKDWYIFWHRKGVKVFKIAEYRDRRLGEFYCKPMSDRWQADFQKIVQVKGRAEPYEIWVSFCGRKGNRPTKEALARLHRVIDSLPTVEPACLQAITDELLETYNTMGWRGDHPEMSREEFIRHFSLNSVSIDGEEMALWYYPEEEIFTDHEVEVILVDGKVTEVGLQG